MADALLKQKNGIAHTSLEEVLCDQRIESRVKDLRKISGRLITNVIYASQAQEHVKPPDAFKDSWRNLKVTIHDTKLLNVTIPRCSGEGNKVTLETFLAYKELNQSVSLFLPGKSRTGKTEIAKLLCLDLAMRYQQGDEEDTKFIMVNTLDSLRNCQACMLPSVPVLLDDIGSGEDNDTQLIYSSISLWKAVLQVPNASQIGLVMTMCAGLRSSPRLSLQTAMTSKNGSHPCSATVWKITREPSGCALPKWRVFSILSMRTRQHPVDHRTLWSRGITLSR